MLANTFSYCPCLSSFWSKPSDPTNPNTNRYCTLCEMAPPMLALVACIVGIAAALTWHSYWLCIPLGVGTLASGYMIHWANINRINKTFHENVADLHQVKEELVAFEIRLGIVTTKDEAVATRLEAVAARIEEKEAFIAKLQRDAESLAKSAAAFETMDSVVAQQKTVLSGLKELQGADAVRAMEAINASNQLLLRTLAEQMGPVRELATAIERSGLRGQAEHLERENTKLTRVTQELGKLEGRIDALQGIERKLGGHLDRFATLLNQLQSNTITVETFSAQMQALMAQSGRQA